MLSDDIARIPLHARDGSVRAYAIVDAVDAALPWVSRYRWSLSSKGVAYRTLPKGSCGPDGRHIRLHRAILGITGWDGIQGDHIDRDKLNNRRSNLRPVTNAQNRQNVGSYRGASSAFRGVCWDKARQMWKAEVRLDRKTCFVGRFASEEDAAIAALETRRRLLPWAVN